MPNMGYLDPNFQQYSHQHHEQMNQQAMPHYEAQHMHNYMAHQNAQMMAIPQQKTTETKPRLGKDEVDILEREFKKNSKPTTQVKRGFAEDMGVDLARINNWFQNRRAKRKQEKKQEAYEAGQAQEALGHSDNASSPDFFSGNGYFNEVQQQQSTAFSLISGPPPAVAPYNPQYQDPSGASMESLQRTLASAAQATQQEYHQNDFLDRHDSMSFGDPVIHEAPEDRAQFPAPNALVARFDEYSFPSTFSNNIYNSPQSSIDLHGSPEDMSNQTPTPYNYSASAESNGAQTVAAFPSQLIQQQYDGLPPLTNDSSDSQSPEESSEHHQAHLALDFKCDITESEDNEISPPAPSIPFKSPAPMDIASRRKKVHVKPAALVPETLRNRPLMAPRTVSHADGFRRGGIESPLASPMRRIVSAGGNRPGGNVISGRICKSGVESAQRSPINLGGFGDADAFLEHNFHSIRQPPSLTALSSVNSSLAPPTPLSPRERDLSLVKRESSRSTASPHEGSMNFVFSAGVSGCYTTMEGESNLVSPPETPHSQLVLHGGPGWPTAIDYQDKQWAFEVPDEPLYTPAQDTFNLEIQMPQPSYLNNMSQPVTPAFGHFNPALIFGHDVGSPQFKNESPQFTLSSHSNAEYAFPDAQGHYPLATLTSPMTKQKTFQFSNTTAADFSEK